MIHLEIVGSGASPRLGRLGLVDSRSGRMGSPSGIYTPSTPTRHIIRIPSSRLKNSRQGLTRTPQPLPEPAEEELPPDYIASVHNAIASYNTTPTSSGRSSPTNVDTQSTLSISQGGWTTGNTTERSSLDSSCYSLDEFDRQAANTVNEHFKEFESMLFEGPKETGSNVIRECQEWVTQFPHLRVLGKQMLAPCDAGYHFTPSACSATNTPRPSTSGTFDLNLSEHDLSFNSDIQGLNLSGRKVKPTKPPPEATTLSTRDRRHDHNHMTNEYDFLHEEIFAQDGVYEDIIAVDYKNIYEDNMEHKKQITPRRRRVGYPPITPNACVKDSVLSAAFDQMWLEIMSWMRTLMKKYAAEVEAKKDASGLELALVPPPSRPSTFIQPTRNSHTNESQTTLGDIIKVSQMGLLRRNNPFGMGPGTEGTDPQVGVPMNLTGLGRTTTRTTTNRPSTVNHSRKKTGPRRLDPLMEPSKVQNLEEGRNHQSSPQVVLRVKGIVPTGGPHRLSSPPNHMGRLPPLESSPGLPSHRKHGHRASSAIDNKEGRSMGGREKSNNAFEVSRPSTTQAFRSETPGYMQNRRSSTPLGGPNTNRQLYLMSGHSMNLGIMGSGLHPSAEPTPNILEDHEGTHMEDIRHNQWIPSTPSYINNFYKRMKMQNR